LQSDDYGDFNASCGERCTDVDTQVNFLLEFGHYLILFMFDAVVIDDLVLSVRRPGFLQLPEAIGAESMKKHILLYILGKNQDEPLTFHADGRIMTA
jgi:hypothetical protein